VHLLQIINLGMRFYLCPEGHQTEQPGICPKDGKSVLAAEYFCEYCDYASFKAGKCPNCEAEMRSVSVEELEVCRWPRSKVA